MHPGPAFKNLIGNKLLRFLKPRGAKGLMV
jgi:hypothetical protein